LYFVNPIQKNILNISVALQRYKEYVKEK